MDSNLMIEIIGWTSTVLFVVSLLVKERSLLHLLGFIACFFKIYYCYEKAVWPLFTNWVILLFVQAWQFYVHRETAERRSSIIQPDAAIKAE